MNPRTITPQMIVAAYRSGYFPMAEGRYGDIRFLYYEPRGIIPLDDRFTVRKSLAKFIEGGSIRITFDLAFEAVMRGCARHDELPDQEVWISEEMIELYVKLHEAGIAHSVEAFEGDTLVGGLYGLALGAVFCGESMFSRTQFASQVALVELVERLRAGRFELLDAQMESEHLKQFGLYTASHAEYLRLLSAALTHPATWDLPSAPTD